MSQDIKTTSENSSPFRLGPTRRTHRERPRVRVRAGDKISTRNVLSLGRPKQNAQPVIFGKGDMQNSFKIFKKMFQKLLKKLLKKSQNLFKKIIKKNLKLLKNFQNF